MVQAIPGAIGYVQYTYAAVTGIPMAELQNSTGAYVAPESRSFDAAVKSYKAKIDPNVISDPSEAAAYPILALSWMIIRKEYADPRKGAALKGVIRYALTEGQNVAGELGYIPFSDETVKMILQKLVETP
jgi:phosphate transport system substrate-binding protein